MKGRVKVWRLGALATFAVLAVIGIPAAGALDVPNAMPEKLLEHVSQGVDLRYWASHVDQAPARLGSALAAVQKENNPSGRHVHGCTNSGNKDVYNCDDLGLPQNEESIASCPTNTDFVLGGTNDYRGLVDPEGNFTGWHWSTDGGHSIRNEGLLPPVELIKEPNHTVPSGGDPVDFIDQGCHLFAGSLAYDPVDPFGKPNGIAVYRSEPAILNSCPGGSDPSCWPIRRLIVENEPSHFLDKEWLFVGVSGGVEYVWVVYSDFDLAPSNGEHPFESVLRAVRCTADLVTCTGPIDISTVDQDVQFGDVTIAPDGRVYFTWARIDGEIEGGPEQTFTIKMRVAAPGSVVPGPESIVHVEDRAIPFGGFLQANDFRVATYPKNDVVPFAGHNRTFVIWDACKVRLLGFVCEQPEIKLKYSDNDGATWVGPILLSSGGVNYFPFISADRNGSQRLAAGWYTNDKDAAFANQQDTVATSINVATGDSRGLKRVTTSSNETEADPLLGGFFVGDYFEGVLVSGNRLYVHYNANYRKVPLLGGFGPPFSEAPAVNQQDNYLTITALN